WLPNDRQILRTETLLPERVYASVRIGLPNGRDVINTPEVGTSRVQSCDDGINNSVFSGQEPIVICQALAAIEVQAQPAAASRPGNEAVEPAFFLRRASASA